MNQKDLIIGIIGQGFVGNSLKEGLKEHFPVITYDLKPELSSCESIEFLVKESDIVFVCVPTPMKINGECHVGIMEGVIKQINDVGIKRIVVLKSTIPPGTTRKMQQKYDNLSIVFNPEFLTEANAVNDFKNQNRIVLGSMSMDSMLSVFLMYQVAFPFIPIVMMKPDEAEMVKYVTNTFLSTKVIFANEIYQMCEEMDIDYDHVVGAAKLDTRLGDSHWKVPGPDGDFGFGGHCFPKDCNAIVYEAQRKGVDTKLLDAVIKKNDEIRINKNWLTQKGRAVI